jgi:hypothetical protein
MIFSPLRQWIEIVKDINKRRKNVKLIKAIAKAGSHEIHVKNLISIKITAGNRLYFVDVNTTKDESKYLSITEIINIGGKKQEKHRIKIYQDNIQEIKKAIDFALINSGIIQGVVPIPEKNTTRYENTYKKWQAEDEIKLKIYYQQKTSIKELSQIFQRRPGAIRSRLRKLGLID